MNPFDDFSQPRGLPGARARRLPPAGSAPSVVRRSVARSEDGGISLSRFATLLALGVLGLAAVLSLCIGGIAVVNERAFPVSVAEEE